MIHALLTALVAAGNWSTPQVLSNGDIALGPELSVAPSGAAIAVWDHESGSDCAQSPASLTCAHIVEYSERPSFLGWSFPRPIAAPGIGARPQAAVNDAGRAAVIWVHDIGRDRVVQATYRTGANESFPNPSDLSAAVLEVREHHVGLDAAGDVAVVWAERHGSDFDVAGEVRNAAAGTWGAPRVLSAGNVRAGPSLAVTPGGDAFAIWLEGSAVLAAHGQLAAGAWDPPVTLSRNGGAGAAVAVNAAGDAVAVWTLGDRPGIEAASRPAGRSWEPAVTVAESGQFNGATAPDVRLAADGTAVATWVGGARVGLLRSSVRAAGGSWSPPVEVGAADTAEPRVTMDARGDALVAWLQRDRVLVSERPAIAGAWQPPEQISDPGASGQDVALDAAGNGFAVWNVRNGTALPVLTSFFSPVAWTPTLANSRRPVVAGPPRAGRAVTCTHGAWTGTIPIGYAYQWLRNGRPNGGGRRYRIRPRDAGTRLACRVSATNAAGTLASTSVPVLVRR